MPKKKIVSHCLTALEQEASEKAGSGHIFKYCLRYRQVASAEDHGASLWTGYIFADTSLELRALWVARQNECPKNPPRNEGMFPIELKIRGVPTEVHTGLVFKED